MKDNIIKASRKQVSELRLLLREKTERDLTGTFAAEGLKIFKDAMLKKHDIVAVFATLENIEADPHLRVMVEEKEPVFALSAQDLKKVSMLHAPDGVITVLKKGFYEKDKLYDRDSGLGVLCDGVQDPGNLGAIIRSCVAFGADFLLLSGDSVDIYNPKVIRASSGMIMDLPVLEVTCDDIAVLKTQGYELYVSDLSLQVKNDISEIREIPDQAIFVFGSEGQGVSVEMKKMADKHFYIPINDKVESLNVSVSVAITLYEIQKIREDGR